WLLTGDFGVDADEEWASYENAIRRAIGVEALEPLLPTIRPTLSIQLRPPVVTFHRAEMNSLPYLVATVGTVFGPPAAALLTGPHERDSALERLRDVFRVGVRGQVFRDFVKASRRLGKGDAEIMADWRACEQAVIWVAQRGE